jgi:predicted transcriptional regulator
MADTNPNDIELISLKIETVGAIVAALAAAGNVTADNIVTVIQNVGSAIDGLTGAAPVAEQAPETREPAVPIRKSITPDFLICLEDGKKLKSMKRYLRTHHNLTPEEYRAKWGLPKDYPMVAPNYAKARSDMAKTMGLGRKPAVAKTEAPKRAPRAARAPAAKEAATA